MFTSGILSMGSSQATFSVTECLSECDFQYNEIRCVSFHCRESMLQVSFTSWSLFLQQTWSKLFFSKESKLALSFTVRSQCSSYLKFTIDRVRESQLGGIRMLIILKFHFKELLYRKYLRLMIYPGLLTRTESVFSECWVRIQVLKMALEFLKQI